MLTLERLSALIGAKLRGDPACQVERVAPLQSAGPGDLTFLSSRRYRRYLAGSRAAAVILSADHLPDCPTSALVMDNPYLGYARAAAALNPVPVQPAGVHPSAWVAPGARVEPSAWIGAHAVVEAHADIGPGVFVGPGSLVGEGASVGQDTRLVARVTLCRGVRVGRRCLLHPGAVVGADGFGFANDGGTWVKIPQLGSVLIGDDVEVGANTTIDRGALGDTVIEDGVKLDNLIQVAHNCRIGAHSAIAGCTGIAGSAVIGRHCVIGGGVGVVGHLEIADGVQVMGRAVVYQSIREPGIYSSGMPLQEHSLWRRNLPRYRQLDELARRVRALEAAAAGATQGFASEAENGHE
jgi:UDP-3-O-[3-hydroxymyristoyl] glucosamine N-acyltransferase